MNKSTNQIKLEIKTMLESGMEPKEVIRQAYKEYGNNDYRSFDGIYGRYVRRWIKHQAKNLTANKTVFKINSNNEGEMTTHIPVPKGQNSVLFNVEDIMMENKLDPKEFEFGSAIVSFYDAQTPDGIQKMQAVKVKVKPHASVSDKAIADMVMEKRDRVVSYLPEEEPVPMYKRNVADRIAVWHAGDIHFGRECKEEEVGIEWNMDLAEKDLHDMKARLIDELTVKPVSKLLMAFTGDGINADTMDGCTAHGTPQDMSARHYKVFRRFLYIMTDIIDEISTVLEIPIEVIHVVGNHDTKTMFDMIVALDAYYRNNPNIEICLEYNHRKYRKFGNSLLTFTHGDTEKSRILDIPSQEEPEAFGLSKYVYIFTEHFHQLKQNSKGQVQAYQTCSPAPGDRWTVKSGYLGSRRGSELFIIDKEQGIVNEAFLNVLNNKRRSFVKEVA